VLCCRVPWLPVGCRARACLACMHDDWILVLFRFCVALIIDKTSVCLCYLILKYIEACLNLPSKARERQLIQHSIIYPWPWACMKLIYTSGHIYIYIYDARRLIKSIVKQKYSCMASNKTKHFLWQIQALIPDFCVILQNNIETISEYTYIHTYIYCSKHEAPKRKLGKRPERREEDRPSDMA
jgi:hypothetical protein